MKLRHSDRVKITLTIPENFPEKQIPPLLFTSYIENAFKHGISNQIESYIDISFQFTAKNIIFDIKNSNAVRITDSDHIGIGNTNSRKRLDLIYGETYTLNIENTRKEFNLNLKLPL